MAKINKYEKAIKQSLRIQSQINRLDKAKAIESQILSDLKITTGAENSTGKTIRNLQQSLNNANNQTNIKKRLAALDRTETYFLRKASEITTWPPEKQQLEITARVIVDELSNEEFRYRIQSAITGDSPVTSESNFYNRTIRQALNSSAVPTGKKEEFINAINRNIDKVNNSMEGGEKIRKVSIYWFRNV